MKWKRKINPRSWTAKKKKTQNGNVWHKKKVKATAAEILELTFSTNSFYSLFSYGPLPTVSTFIQQHFPRATRPCCSWYFYGCFTRLLSRYVGTLKHNGTYWEWKWKSTSSSTQLSPSSTELLNSTQLNSTQSSVPIWQSLGVMTTTWAHYQKLWVLASFTKGLQIELILQCAVVVGERL